ncbi:eukaryotic aspartyl protease family protein [Tasmannia lanceolata]|uniref:eukaryotic aspartyl protease family protein n=1 Tax=Tasmannia lanceolata TaxID=3420 RepID=UPI0040636679
MALCKSLLLLFFLSLSTAKTLKPQNPKSLQTQNYSLKFPLISLPLSSPITKQNSQLNTQKTSSIYKSTFKYTMALVLSLPIGTPPQTQQMVLDTGSQLSWTQCTNKTLQKPPSSSFDPSLSSSFSLLPCNTPQCKPRIPDFTLPTSCDQNLLCHYSYFYADGTYAEGNLVKEKISINSLITPPLILGCSQDSSANEGILGMNLGRLSFPSQAKINKFSYCVPPRWSLTSTPPAGTFYIGENPYSGGFRYVNLLRFSGSESRPYLDKAAYTIGIEGIKIGGKILNISRECFRPDSGGAGQTMIDSGTEFSFLVESAYDKVKEEVEKRVLGGAGRVKKVGTVYGGALDMCFEGDVAEIRRLLGDMVLVMENGVEIVTEGVRAMVEIGGGVSCLSFGSSQLLGVESNIVGNFHQQNLWVEFDVLKSRVGFGKADCTKV